MQLRLKYPPFPVRLRKSANGATQVFDALRRKWLALTPEEWVRQHIVHFLISEKKVPAGFLSIEKKVVLNGMQKRYDIVVFTRDLKPWLVVECKAPYVELTREVAEQAMRYNLTLGAEYIMISNGVSEMVFFRGSGIDELPGYVGGN